MSRLSVFFSSLGRPGLAGGFSVATAAAVPNQAARTDSRSRRTEPFGEQPNAAGFARLDAAYLPSGGMMRIEDVARLMTYRGSGSLASLTGQIAARQVLAVHFRDALWVPLFQFEFRSFGAKDSVRSVLAELAETLDNWALAVWFVEANLFLRGRRPVDIFDASLQAVIAAARGDRLIARGDMPARQTAEAPKQPF